MTFRQSVEDSKGGFERLVSHIPGYHGYKEKETRREADKMLRDHLAKQLDAERRRLAELQRQLVDGGNLLLVDDLDRAVTKVQKLVDMVRTASYGYAGIFDATKVKEDELDALYVFDEGMLGHALSIQEAIDDLQTAIDSNGDLPASIRRVVTVAEEANATWRRREEAITGAA